MSRKDALRPSVVLLLIFMLPAIAAAFLPKAIYSAVNANFANSWIGFTLFGIFFAMGIAGLITILNFGSCSKTSDEIQKSEKLVGESH